MVLDLDLNGPPRVEDLLVMDNGIHVNTNLELGLPRLQVMANSDAPDDDVVICSPRSFVEAKKKSRRNHPVIEVLDEESDANQGPPGAVFGNPGINRRWRDPRRNKASVLCIDLEAPMQREGYNRQQIMVSRQPAALAAQPKPPAFSCPICMGQFVEETSTKCGHIFCKKCIVAAIAVQGKCPTCRYHPLKEKDTFRIYLPTSY